MGDSIRSLQTIPLFAELAPPELERLCRLLEERMFEKNQVISQEGEPWDGLYIVKSGKVKLSKRSMGRELTIAILESGEPLNIAPLFEGGPSVFTAQAMGRVIVYYLSEANAHTFVSDHPPVQRALLHVLNRRLYQLVSLVSELAFKDVSARLASWILEQSRERGIRTSKGNGIKRDLTIGELASLMGTVPRVLSRSLSKLTKDRAIEVTSQMITIIDQGKLKAIAQER